MKKRLPAGRQGFALIIAVIFMTVMLTLGLAMSSLGYKQSLLASTAVESQYAFYAADAALECALLVDQKTASLYSPDETFFVDPSSTVTLCGVAGHPLSTTSPSGRGVGSMISYIRNVSVDANRCADITVYKPQADTGDETFIFSQGYDVSCDKLGSGTRFVSRGIYSHY